MATTNSASAENHSSTSTSATTSSATTSTSTSEVRPVICVFCGSKAGTSPSHLASARALARAFHTHSISLVYGGGSTGLMGELARTLVSLSGPSSVHGVIPEALVRLEALYDSTTTTTATASEIGAIIKEEQYGKTTVVKDMHARKARMASLVQQGGPGSGFVALAGGFGTLEELMEVVTWNYLGIHDKGVVVFNVEGYWDGLMRWVERSVEEGFVGRESGAAGILMEAKDAEAVVRALREYRIGEGRLGLKWGEE